MEKYNEIAFLYRKPVPKKDESLEIRGGNMEIIHLELVENRTKQGQTSNFGKNWNGINGINGERRFRNKVPGKSREE